jgi:hypothetical protein
LTRVRAQSSLRWTSCTTMLPPWAAYQPTPAGCVASLVILHGSVRSDSIFRLSIPRYTMNRVRDEHMKYFWSALLRN